MADPTTNDLPALLEIQRRVAAGEMALTAEQAQRMKAKLDTYAQQGLYKPTPGVSPSGLPIRDLNVNERNTLNTMVDTFQRSNNLVATYNPDYAGAPGLGALENKVQSKFGGIGTPGQADWWRNFNEVDSQERFKLFGASLTGSEKEAWARTTVGPGDDPQQVANKIATRQVLAKAATARYVNSLIAGGVAPQIVEAMVGGKQGLDAVLAPMKHSTQVGDKQFTFEAPADATPEQIQTAAAQEAQKQGIEAAPENFRTDYSKVQAPSVDAAQRDTFGGAVDAGVRGLADSLTLGADNKIVAGFNAVLPLDRLSGRDVSSIWDGMSLGDAYQANLRRENQIDAIDEQVNPGARLAGQVAGGVLGVSKLKAAPTLLREGARNFGLGAAYGINTASDRTSDANEIVKEGLTTGALSAVGGQAANTVGKVVGKTFTGAKNATADFLQSKGITLTPGQILGGTAKTVEDALTGIPGVRDVINARRGDAVQDFNRAIMSDALAPIGAKAPDDIGEKGVLYMQEKVGEAYAKALGGVKLSVDDAYKAEMGQVLKAAQDLPADLREQFVATMKNRVDKLFTRNKDGSVTLNGESFQDALQGIRKDVSALYKNNNVQADVFDGVASQAEEVLINLAKRQSPGTAEALDAANAAYRNKSIVQKAVLLGQNADGVFTPAQLGRASTTNTLKYGGDNVAAAGNRPFFDLQRAAQNTLPSQVPDSGTYTRAAIGNALGIGGIAGAGGYAANEGLIDPSTAVTLGVLAAPFTRTGSKAMNTVLTKRPEAVAKAGEFIAKSSAPEAIGVSAGALYGAGPRDTSVTVDPRTGILYDAEGKIVGVNRQ